jgi:SAM-dependent methyltransferase
MRYEVHDINKYWENYQQIYSFEEILRTYREKKVLEFISDQIPSHLLEIGCGFTPVFEKFKAFKNYVAIEPGWDAYRNAVSLSKGENGITIINNRFENCTKSVFPIPFDCVISTGVLHEVEDPALFLRLLDKVTAKDAKIYLNVPNARSFHRELAKHMGLISSVFEKSERNEKLQQKSNFDMNALSKLIKGNLPNFEITDLGTFFIKPFTHDQMMALEDSQLFSSEVFDGLYEISKLFPGFGCELFCILTKMCDS